MLANSIVCRIFSQMAEERTSYDRNCEARRNDLKRLHSKRLQDFDLITTTSGLDLVRVIEATESPSAGQPRTGAVTGVAVGSSATLPAPSARQGMSSIARKESAAAAVSRSEMNLTSLPFDSAAPQGAAASANRLKDAGSAVSRSELNLAAVQPVAASAAASLQPSVVKQASIVNRRPPEPPAKKPGRQAPSPATTNELPSPQSTRL